MARKPVNPENVHEYLKSKYKKDWDTQCFEWTGSVNKAGYGVVQLKMFGAPVLAHRLSFMVNKCPIPNDAIVCHVCNNKICINPDHLVLGTHQDNADHRVLAGTAGRKKMVKRNYVTKRKVIKRPEQNIQIGLARELDKFIILFPDEFFWWHTPNGGGRSKAEGGILKSMGVKAGVCDLIFTLSFEGMHRVVMIELKTGSNTPSNKQDDFIDKMNGFGIPSYVVVANDIPDAMQQVFDILSRNAFKGSKLEKALGNLWIGRGNV